MSKKSTNEQPSTEETGPAPCSTLALANEMIQQQEYLLNRQSELFRVVVAKNNNLVAAANQAERENHKLKKELDGYKRGKLWTAMTSFLPTVGFGGDRY